MSNTAKNQTQSFHIELISDINRSKIEIFCPEIYSAPLEDTCNHLKTLLDKANIDYYSTQRVVYSEISENLENAILRLEELNKFTNTQKRKLIRKQNPNWRSIRFVNLNTLST